MIRKIWDEWLGSWVWVDEGGWIVKVDDNGRKEGLGGVEDIVCSRVE